MQTWCPVLKLVICILDGLCLECATCFSSMQESSEEEVEEVQNIEDVPDIPTFHGCEVPGNGYGTITAIQRELILKLYGVKVACRQRDGWECKWLTLFGNSRDISKAKAMAEGFIFESEKKYNAANPGPDTPGAENDPFRTAAGGIPNKKSKAEQKRQKQADRSVRIEQQRDRDMQAHRANAQRLAWSQLQNQMMIQRSQVLQEQMLLAKTWGSAPLFPFGCYGPPQPTFDASPMNVNVKVEPKVKVKVKSELTKVKLEPGVGAGAKRFRRSNHGDGDVLEEAKDDPIMMEISDDGIIY